MQEEENDDWREWWAEEIEEGKERGGEGKVAHAEGILKEVIFIT